MLSKEACRRCFFRMEAEACVWADNFKDYDRPEENFEAWWNAGSTPCGCNLDQIPDFCNNDLEHIVLSQKGKEDE